MDESLAWSDYERLKAYILEHVPDMLKAPRGIIRYPFIDPGSVYHGNVWDWDTFWSVYGLFSLWEDMNGTMQAQVLEHAMGNVRNFFDHQMEDGYIPIMIADNGKDSETYLNRQRRKGISFNMHKPFLASQTLMICRKTGDAEWARIFAGSFRRYLNCYDTYFHQNSGLYVWHDDIMIGVDNDPASFGRPPESTANIFLNAFMTKELRDLAELYRLWNMPEDERRCMDRRGALLEAIQSECWDERDGYFYSVDVDVHTRQFDWFHRGLGVFWKSLPIKVRVWSGLIPLYCGIATRTQAERLRAHAVDPQTFFAPYGVRTLARDEKMYDLSATNNPSNWLGPIWLVANYIVARGLLNYGYEEEARRISACSLRLMANDLDKTGCLHEYYDPETGAPVMNGGFINWNILALTIAKETGLSDDMARRC